MRYPIIFIILTLLVLAMPFEKQKPDGSNRPSLVGMVLNEEQQQNGKSLLDNAVVELRALKPTHQLLLMTTAIILLLNAAVVLSYLINSIAAIAGIGVSLTVLLPLLLLAMLGLLVGWRAPRKTLHRHMKGHAEFGPFVSRLSTLMWKRRFARAAREHGFAREF